MTDVTVRERVLGKLEELIHKEGIPSEVKELAEVMESLLEIWRPWTSEERFELILRELGMVREEMNTRFEAMDERFKAVLSEMNSIRQEANARFEAMEKRFEALLREMDSRFETMEKRFDALLREMNARFEAVIQEMRASLEAMERRFKMLLWWIPLWFTVLNAFIAILLKLLKLI